ncbi:MAG TPA: UxaA family hydrolase [Candidatus Deferrimicrobium sp.]|nr:UxaA family hydrolase [Candidatus Deferrimicrobium sp.]
MNFLGYKRENGSIGIRNLIAIIPSVICSAHAAQKIADAIPNSVCLTHPYGCGHFGADWRRIVNNLAGLGKNPNVAAALVVGLGCENVTSKFIAKEIEKTGKPTQFMDIQKSGGTEKTIKKGIEIASEMRTNADQLKKQSFGLEKLVLGLECGGSDATSGLIANPAVGVASDTIVKAGGTAILPEFIEWVGTEHNLAKRCVKPEDGELLIEMIDTFTSEAQKQGYNMRMIAPGNIRGGLTTIEEKALGTICKAGKAPIQGLLSYGEPPPVPGLWLMVEPGLDVESMTGLASAGAQVCTFTTGQGTPTGNAIMPVIKISGNPETMETMGSDIDLDATAILSGKETVDSFGLKILEEIIAVANGKATIAEKMGHQEFAIWRLPIMFNLGGMSKKFERFFD